MGRRKLTETERQQGMSQAWEATVDLVANKSRMLQPLGQKWPPSERNTTKYTCQSRNLSKQSFFKLMLCSVKANANLRIDLWKHTNRKDSSS